jgi:hypothetical protein
VHAHLTYDALDAVTGGASAADLVPARIAAGSSHRKILLSLTWRWQWRVGVGPATISAVSATMMYSMCRRRLRSTSSMAAPAFALKWNRSAT